LVEEGKVLKKEAQMLVKGSGVWDALFHSRPCPEGIFAQNLNGISRHVKTTQEHLSVTKKSTAEWMRCRTPLPRQTDQMTALGFLMDGALSFVPLAFSHLYFDNTTACSSLDFALRVFSNKIDVEAWHLRELVTDVAAEGRSYCEGRLFDEEGRCVASMTQQGIMRALPGGKATGKL
jgi:acyl-CoA thioesterase